MQRILYPRHTRRSCNPLRRSRSVQRMRVCAPLAGAQAPLNERERVGAVGLGERIALWGFQSGRWCVSGVGRCDRWAEIGVGGAKPGLWRVAASRIEQTLRFIGSSGPAWDERLGSDEMAAGGNEARSLREKAGMFMALVDAPVTVCTAG